MSKRVFVKRPVVSSAEFKRAFPRSVAFGGEHKRYGIAIRRTEHGPWRVKWDGNMYESELHPKFFEFLGEKR
jgi:hypothetical protein